MKISEVDYHRSIAKNGDYDLSLVDKIIMCYILFQNLGILIFAINDFAKSIKDLIRPRS